ncbi:tetratricopeptide repeat protein [Marinomonas posidonica]|uniref:tetratricopeptide repeat protein n=1 Tax=Marinomonas posidonica TaxID=936476 RepID=UPI003736CEFB
MLFGFTPSSAQRSTASYTRAKWWLVSFCLPFLFACSQTRLPESNVFQETANDQTQRHEESQISDLLKAEFTLQREGPNKAYDNFYSIAQESKDPAFIERLVRIAVASRNKVYIEQSADLWRSVEPTSEQAYSLAMQVYAQGERPNDIAKLLDTAMLNHVPLRFFPLYLEDNVRDSQVMDTLESAIKMASPLTQKNQFIRLSQAHLWLLSGQYEQARQQANALIEDPSTEKSEALYLILAYSEKNQNQLDKAISTLTTANQTYPQSVNILSPLLNLLVENEQAQTAIKLLDNTSLSEDDKLQACLNLARTLLEYKQPDLAFNVLNGLPQQRAFRNQIYYLQAIALDELGRHNDAIERMNQVHGTLQSSATNQMALWLYEQGRQKDINDLVLTRTNREYLPEQVTTISQLHQEKGQPMLAYDLLTKAVDLFPESDELRYQKSLFAEHLGYWDITLEELNNLLEKHPNNAQYLNALGYTLLTRTDQLDKAMIYIERAYELSDDDPAIIDSLGWGMFLKGEYEQSSYYLEKAWSILQDAEIAAHYGESLWRQRHYDQALSIWKTALQQSPNATILLDTIKRLSPSLLENHQQDENS